MLSIEPCEALKANIVPVRAMQRKACDVGSVEKAEAIAKKAKLAKKALNKKRVLKKKHKAARKKATKLAASKTLRKVPA